MAADTSPTVRRRRLASELRRLRIEHGLSMQEVAERMDLTAASISRMETGRRGIRPRDLRAFLDMYGVVETGREPLLALAKEARQRGWWQNYGDVLPGEYATLIGLEAEAASTRTYQQTLVPGLLQTAEYARSVIAASRPGDAPEDVERRASVRMERQKRLTGQDPLELSVILGEGVVHQHVGTAQITADQFHHLAEANRRPNVMIQILPYRAGAHPAMTGSFTIVGFPAPSDLDVIYLENMSSGLYLEDAADVRRYVTVFDYLRAAALSPADTTAMLMDASKNLS
ncbi:Helix-turn-helix domain-containing protein [Streptosporangium canum]|uniref:Helix-turn-helix domain-containing protein n=1 Tax=Streptosporangium canum TaxID=324952 RepID=A0A1I3U9F5_9ACTN|nr:helix-turn-helix transcriptional regulator [Streptosporangium canum]SFJ78391.1 Helix-turn-helix domain-containing protein [Streptosporangium canum]